MCSSDLLDAQKLSLFETVKRSLVRYGEQPRSEWALSKEADTGRPHDPAQTTLLVLAINYVAEVEQALEDIQHRGDVDALSRYSQKQREQLNDLIKLTRTGLTKGDRARIMNCITMDAHSRDVVESMIRQNVGSVDRYVDRSLDVLCQFYSSCMSCCGIKYLTFCCFFIFHRAKYNTKLPMAVPAEAQISCPTVSCRPSGT